jgi:hypothetical protein
MEQRLEDTLRHNAAHEICHSLYAESQQYEVHSVSFWPDGISHIKFPLQPDDLLPQFREHPLQTLALLKGIIGTLYAPYIVQGELLRGGDLELLTRYEKAWRFVQLVTHTNPRPPVFKEVYHDARSAVGMWHDDAGRRRVIGTLTQELVKRKSLDRSTWRMLLERHYEQWLAQRDKSRATTY